MAKETAGKQKKRKSQIIKTPAAAQQKITTSTVTHHENGVVIDGVYYERTTTTAPFLEEADTFAQLLYKPHTITGLILCLGFVIYGAFWEIPGTTEANVKKGLAAAVVVFLLYCMLQLRDGIVLRPHPAPWRIVQGAAIIYLLAIVFALFQTVDDVRQFLRYLYPDLGVPLPERSYGDTCDVYTPNDPVSNFRNIRDTVFDEFILAHVGGFWGKAVLIRDLRLSWVLSVFFEILELTFQHWLPNFKECWWDHLIVDVFTCNALGIYLGLKTCHYFQLKEYHWIGLSEIKSTKGKITRVLQQFTPFSFQPYNWEAFSSLKRMLYFVFLAAMISVSDLSAFFIKYILWVPPRNMLNTYRVFLWFLMSIPGIREYYQYVTDPKSKRLGANGWLLIAMMCVELMLQFKFGKGMFTARWPANVAICWIAFILLSVAWTAIYFSLIAAGKKRAANSTPMNVLFWSTLVPFTVLFFSASPDLRYGEQWFEAARDTFNGWWN